MIRLAISVEGETEEAFVKGILTNHLRKSQVEPTPILLGGNVTVPRLAAEMTRLYWNFDQVTSLVDFYGFRGKGNQVSGAIGTSRIGRSRPQDCGVMEPISDISLHPEA